MDLWQILEIVGAGVGLFYLWLEYRASIWLWLVGIVMPAIYIYVYYKSGFYADVGINIYYLLAGIYGWFAWMGKRIRAKNGAPGTARATADEGSGGGLTAADAAVDSGGGAVDAGSGGGTGGGLPVSRMPWRSWLPAMAAGLVFFAIIAWILINFTDSTVPYGDSFTTAFSIVALWMLSRKYAEQWLVWLVVDLICSGLYFYKGLHYTGALYGFYAVVAVFGYLKWLKMIDNGAKTSADTDA